MITIVFLYVYLKLKLIDFSKIEFWGGGGEILKKKNKEKKDILGVLGRGKKNFFFLL